MDLKQLTTYEAICKADGVDPIESLPFQRPKSEEEFAVNEVSKTFRTIRVINDGWKPDWGNYNQRKYTLWYDMRPASAGGSASGFALGGVGDDPESSAVGSRLVFESREKASHYANHFLGISRGWMVIVD